MRPAQKVALGVVLASAALPLWVRLYRRLRCLVRGYHEPQRQPLGGFRCVDCHLAGETFDDLGFKGGSYVGPLRRTFDRGPHGGFTRSEGYETETRHEELRRVEPFVRGRKFDRRQA